MATIQAWDIDYPGFQFPKYENRGHINGNMFPSLISILTLISLQFPSLFIIYISPSQQSNPKPS